MIEKVKGGGDRRWPPHSLCRAAGLCGATSPSPTLREWGMPDHYYYRRLLEWSNKIRMAWRVYIVMMRWSWCQVKSCEELLVYSYFKITKFSEYNVFTGSWAKQSVGASGWLVAALCSKLSNLYSFAEMSLKEYSRIFHEHKLAIRSKDLKNNTSVNSALMGAKDMRMWR